MHAQHNIVQFYFSVESICIILKKLEVSLPWSMFPRCIYVSQAGCRIFF